MKRSEVDWRSGTVTYWVLDSIDETAPFSVQLEELREDLAQVCYANGVLIDIGWYPSFSPSGRFMVLVIKDEDWEHPIAREHGASFGALRTCLAKAVAVATAAAGLQAGV